MPDKFDITEAVGFFDASCDRCGKRYGWRGKLADKPPCPKCGREHKPEVVDRCAKQRIEEGNQ